MKYLILSFLIASSLYSNTIDLVELYRAKGIQAVEKELTNQLQTKNYWDLTLQKKDVSKGYYESIQYVMMCQKDLKDIRLYDTKLEKEEFNSDVFVGEVDGDKKVEGDLKTPIGAYKLTRKITNLDPFYGSLALVTNYPNNFDKSLGKTGHGIWIHGLPFNQERDDYTQGCIALDNEKIKTLDSKISLKKSILIVSEDKLEEVSKDDISIVLSNIFEWRDAWKESDIDAYLSFYNKDFKKSNGENLVKFANYKKRVFSKNEKKQIEFFNINIMPYPNDMNKKIYKVVMDELYKTRTYKFDGKKELYLEILNGKISILNES